MERCSNAGHAHLGMTAKSTQHSERAAVSVANGEAIEAWNTVLFDKFSRYREVVSRLLGGFGDAVMNRCRPAPGERFLDVGCGFGDTTIELARRVGADGLAVGVDAAPRFIDEARGAAAQAGIDNARFEIADAQTAHLGRGFDAAYSRFGTMFFESPVLALRNIRSAMTPGGRLAMVVWRNQSDNEFLDLPARRAREIVGDSRRLDGPTCGPGPFSMADPNTLRVVLAASGFAGAVIERHDAMVCLGLDLDEAVEIALELGPAGELLRLSADGERRRADVAASVREGFTPFSTDDGVLAGASVWLVSARVA